MVRRQIPLLFAVVVLGLSAYPGQANADAPTKDASAQCKALERAGFAQTPDAPTQIIAARLVDQSGDTPSYCQVGGYVTPNVGFLLRLPPFNWNGKFIELGCSGACGSTEEIASCDGPLRRGYACIVSNGGHQSTGGDMKWAYNNPQAVIDYVSRAPHLTALAGKAIVERYYTKTPRKSYFLGCSAGGLQASWEAQKFPWDFDGIVAGSPSYRATDIMLRGLWSTRAFVGRDGKSLLQKVDLELLHHAVVAKCDMNDGLKDGLIGDPRVCRFDPRELRCAPGKTNECLTGPQIDAVERIYGGPITSNGEQITTSSAMRGSELNWYDTFSPGSTDLYNYSSSGLYNYFGDWFRYYLFQPNPGPAWKPEDLDFDHDYKRLGMGEMVEAVNPDLRRFKSTGAKMLLYAGWNDHVGGVLDTVDYYETAEKIIGQRTATQGFLRLFMIPGMDHCTGGEGAFAVDYLSYLDNWVEKGQAPDKLIASHVRVDHAEDVWYLKFPLDPARVEFSRPVYPYPTVAKYLGRGDPKDAANFGPAEP